MLQASFTIICGSACLMKEELDVIIRTCMILHNMIIENERDNYKLAFDCDVVEGTVPEPILKHDHYPCHETYFRISKEICDPNTHATLQAYLIKETSKWNSFVDIDYY